MKEEIEMKKIMTFLFGLSFFIGNFNVYAYDENNKLTKETKQDIEDTLIEGYVFKDINHSGQMDDNEGISYLKMNLWQENNLVDVTMTDEDGYYCFKNMKKGQQYQIIAECLSDCTLMKNQFSSHITNHFTIMQDYQVKTDKFIMDKSSLQFHLGFMPIAYHVEYQFEGGTGSFDLQQKNYKEKSIVKIPLTENLSKEGYSFLGWNTQKDGSGEMYQANQSFVMPAHNVKLYAIWQKDSQKVSLQQINQKAHIVQTSDHFDLSVILLFLLSIWSLLVIKNLNKNR